MLDPQLFRNDPDAVAAALASRGYTLDVDAFRSLETERKAIQMQTQELQSRRNAASKEIGIRKSKGEDTSTVMADVASIGDDLKNLERELEGIQQHMRELMLEIPNLA